MLRAATEKRQRAPSADESAAPALGPAHTSAEFATEATTPPGNTDSLSRERAGLAGVGGRAAGDSERPTATRLELRRTGAEHRVPAPARSRRERPRSERPHKSGHLDVRYQLHGVASPSSKWMPCLAGKPAFPGSPASRESLLA
ncbi:hypothetical protein HPB47_002462 [Ixodes persulcatus]|uniref:Uncharacterized protein n=1 Tax=Ixodes persulcatus TaxID=34615 RepID=A0AC60PMC8_IXOPE|nr:hypothetical protein HPB47_002462 [Ixodes persulcatus]